MVETDYRSSHLGAEKAESYNRDFGEGFLGYFWQNVERPLFFDLLTEIFPAGLGEVDHLDVACGTGRILAAASEHTTSSLGIDVSPHMVEFAEVNAPRATAEVADVTSLERNESFDLVTAFRFFLNAEDALRVAALQSIWETLRPGGYLVTNIHASPWSIVGMGRRAATAIGRRHADNTMAHADFAEFLSSVGLVHRASRTYGFVPVSTRVPRSLMRPLSTADRWIAKAMPDAHPAASIWLVAAQKPPSSRYPAWTASSR